MPRALSGWHCIDALYAYSRIDFDFVDLILAAVLLFFMSPADYFLPRDGENKVYHWHLNCDVDRVYAIDFGFFATAFSTRRIFLFRFQ